MGKVFFRLKKNNKGVSLVEVLVTIAMVAIMAGPLLNSFLNAMGVNGKARNIQNGTTVAQDMMEKVKSLSLDSLDAEYLSYKVANTSGDGIISYKNIPIKGPNNEKFVVDITLDPTPYKLANSDKEEVNEINLPGMSSLHGSDSIMLYKEYAAMDEQLKGLFGANLPSSVGDLMAPEYRRYISKDTNINIKCTYLSAADKYDYDVTLTMRYTYNNNNDINVTVAETKVIEDRLYASDVMHSVYLVCPVFDLYTQDIVGNTSYATDKINIFYSFVGDEEKKKNLYFYLAEQKAINLENSVVRQRIDSSNVYVDSKNIPVYKSSETNVKLYTNIGVNDEDLTDLTYIDRNTGIALYEMKVQVRLEGDSKILAEFTGAK